MGLNSVNRVSETKQRETGESAGNDVPRFYISIRPRSTANAVMQTLSCRLSSFLGALRHAGSIAACVDLG